MLATPWIVAFLAASASMCSDMSTPMARSTRRASGRRMRPVPQPKSSPVPNAVTPKARSRRSKMYDTCDSPRRKNSAMSSASSCGLSNCGKVETAQ